MTRHRDELAVFVDRSSLPHYGDVPMNVERRGLIDPEQPVDDRSDAEIVAAMGKSVERVTAPRNALDVLGLPTPPQNVQMAGIQETGPQVWRSTANPHKIIEMLREARQRQGQ